MFIKGLCFGQVNDSLVIYPGEMLYKDTVIRDLIVYAPTGSKVKVIALGGKYSKVMYKEYTGWVLKEPLITEQEYIKLEEEQKAIRLERKRANELAEKKEREAAEKARLKAKEEKEKAQLAALNKRRTALIQRYGSQEVAEKIIAKKIWIGMTDKMARDSWGAPNDINRTVTAYGTSEQWVYDKMKTYLYFENGILTSWQD